VGVKYTRRFPGSSIPVFYIVYDDRTTYFSPEAAAMRDALIEEVAAWCRDQFGSDRYIDGVGIIRLRDQTEATAFMLRFC
jgi:hypothetical protein